MVAVLSGLRYAVPAAVTQQALWDGFFAAHYGHRPTARRLFAAAGVSTRHAVANPLDEDVSGWTTRARMDRYAEEAMPLAKQAAAQALADAGLAAGDVGLLAVASCTGYGTPGVDLRLARDLGMATDLQRLFVGHMGCYAALPALAAAGDFVVARSRPALVLCLELTSLHVQPPSDDIGQMVSHSLFSDAAAAFVVRPEAPAGLELIDVTARTDHSTAEHMTWDVTDLGFRMQLSPRVPDVLAKHVRPVVVDLLQRHGLGVDEVAGWAVHPGGPRILDVVQRELGLPGTALAASRRTLAEHGNCSSATVLLVLAQVLPDVPVGGYVVMTAFGPGLTLYAALLRRRGAAATTDPAVHGIEP